jgi:HK97 family phage major capsid protein
MSHLLNAQRHWSRADAAGRAELAAALAGMTVGQRLRVADVVGRAPGAAPAGSEAAAGSRTDALPPLVDFVSIGLRAGSVDPETRECELSFSSEAPYERWWGIEVLGHAASEVDMSWMASGRAPFLSDHDACEQIGVITRAWIDRGRKGRAVVRFGKSDDAEQEMQDAMDAVRVNVSVGYEIRELELVKQEGDVKTYRVTDWMPLECSLVAIPADMTVGIGRSAPAPTGRTPATPKTPEPMMTTPTTEKTGDQTYRDNVATIGRLAEAYSAFIKPADMAKAIADGADAFKFQELILQRMQSGATDVTTTAALGVSRKEVAKYSFMRALQAMIPGANVDAGIERELSRAIAQQVGREAEGIFIPSDIFAGRTISAGQADGTGRRDFTVGTSTEAGNLVQTDVAGQLFTDVLRPALVMGRMGITILPGLRSNLLIPRKSVAGTLAMLTEVAAAAETQPNTTQVTMSPKRISAFVEPSKQAIIQSEVGIEAMIRDDLLSGAAVLIENQGINGSGTSPNARGIRNVSGVGSVVGGTNGLALAWSHVTGLEAAVANANSASTDRAGYLVNTKAVNTAKNTQKAPNLPFIWDNTGTPLNGYRAGVTNNVPSNLTKGTSSGVCSSVVFSSDWSMFVLGLFGGLDITVDPYTLASTGQIRITLNQFIDWACRQPGAFSVMDDALTP